MRLAVGLSLGDRSLPRDKVMRSVGREFDMMIKRALMTSILLLASFAFGLAGCASSNAEPQAVTGETHAYQDTNWAQP